MRRSLASTDFVDECSIHERRSFFLPLVAAELHHPCLHFHLSRQFSFLFCLWRPIVGARVVHLYFIKDDFLLTKHGFLNHVFRSTSSQTAFSVALDLRISAARDGVHILPDAGPMEGVVE